MANSAKILIVDDNEINRNVLDSMVAALGHTAVLAENGVSALAKMEQEQPDLVLLDILMPEMNGYETLEHMKGKETLRQIPVIIISAITELESVVRCIEKGADDYFAKPFNAVLLHARISSCLEKKRLRDSERHLHGELQKNYLALQNAEQARDALVHMLVHDLRNPVTTILGYMQLLQLDISSDIINRDRCNTDFQRIYNSLDEMETLITGMLDVSRLENGEMPVSLVPLDPVAIMNDLCERFIRLAKRKKVHLSVYPGSETVLILADKDLFSRIIQNLITNALKYANTTVNLSVERQDNGVIICIVNDGPGILEKYREKIFDKYFQIQEGSERKHYGVGLGLAFCKMAVEAQGGKIWVENREEKGAIFKVSLKLADRE